MRVLVTGADGFVGNHLRRYLREHGHAVAAWAGPGARPHEGLEVIDVRDARAVADAVARARPDAIVHLAAVSSVAQSHSDPALTFQVNAMGTLHLCVAARALSPSPRILLVSSGEVYGPTPPGRPATEETPPASASPYAASKVASETIARQFARSYGLDVVCARPFDHLGKGQLPTFAIPAFARQIASADRTRGPVVVAVGNLDPIRDFSHVDDVVAAYGRLLERGIRGEIYNVCSGVGRSIRQVLDELIAVASADVEVRVNPAKVRASDVPALVGDPSKIRALGWTPRRTLRDALRDVLDGASGTADSQ